MKLRHLYGSLYGPIFELFELLGAILSRLETFELFGAICSHLEAFGAICNYLEVVWSYFELVWCRDCTLSV